MTTTTEAEELKTLAKLKVSPKFAAHHHPDGAVHAANIASWVMVIGGYWPAWVGLVINSISGYVMFTPAHESIHVPPPRSPSTTT